MSRKIQVQSSSTDEIAVGSLRDTELTGGVGTSTTSARAGLLPISLERAPVGAFDGVMVYLRIRDPQKQNKARFTLYCAEHVAFTAEHRESLRSHGVQFVYIPIADQERFGRQTEATLLQTVADASMSVSVKSEIVYETSVALVNELLTEPLSLVCTPRLEKLSKAVTLLVLNDPQAFSHLFAASHHDFYTATHMVNVATWMVPLSYAMGHRGSDELSRICLAGLLHDVGKLQIASEILNKKGRLTDAEWQIIRQHPQLGCEYLKQFPDIPPLVHRVVLEHHERLNGSGYPNALTGEAIHPVSRICAVVDSFDAMTALRPFKQRTLTAAQALSIIARETPTRYDPAVLQAWLTLLRGAEDAGTLSESLQAFDGSMRRRSPRFRIRCPARICVLEQHSGNWVERSDLAATAHNISRGGLAVLSEVPVRPNETVRVYLLGRGTLHRVHEGLIVRCRDFRDGWHEIGMKFLALISEEDLAGLEVTKTISLGAG